MRKTGSVVFLLFGLFLIASILYLPQHIVFIANRAWFYAAGGDMDSASPAAAAAAAAVHSSKDAVSLTVPGAATAESVMREL